MSWLAAFESFSAADPSRLGADDLESFATAAFMLGRDVAYVDAWERAYDCTLKAGDPARAARCTWWIGDYLRFRARVGGAVTSPAEFFSDENVTRLLAGV